jgi:hypothetical protein
MVIQLVSRPDAAGSTMPVMVKVMGDDAVVVGTVPRSQSKIPFARSVKGYGAD